jgi:hypothetical protein
MAEASNMSEVEKLQSECDKLHEEINPLMSEVVEKILYPAQSKIEDGTRMQDICLFKSFSKPPRAAQLASEALCILCDIPPLPRGLPDGTTVQCHWMAAKKMLQDHQQKMKFHETLKVSTGSGDMTGPEFLLDRDNIPTEVVQRVESLLETQGTEFETNAGQCRFSEAIWAWAHAMVEYHKKAVTLRPKIEELKAACAKLKAAQASE